MGKRWFWAAVAAQVLALVALIGVHQYTLSTGTPVLVKTELVDPWDVFRGSYVHLQPEIARLDPSLLRGDAATLRRGDTVWVVLQPGNPYWTPVAFGAARLVPAAAQVAVKGQFLYGPIENNNRGEGTPPPPPALSQYVVEYSFEAFYASDARAKELAGRRTGLDLRVRVDRFGNAALEQVLVDGTPLHWQ